MDYLKGNNKKQQCMQLSFNKQQHVLKVQFKIVMGLLHYTFFRLWDALQWGGYFLQYSSKQCLYCTVCSTFWKYAPHCNASHDLKKVIVNQIWTLCNIQISIAWPPTQNHMFEVPLAAVSTVWFYYHGITDLPCPSPSPKYTHMTTPTPKDTPMNLYARCWAIFFMSSLFSRLACVMRHLMFNR